MVHFPGLARTRLCIQRAVAGFFPAGFPHSDIPGLKGVSPSPRLFAGNRVLHRRLAPRHPPYALSSLTITSAQHINQLAAYKQQSSAKALGKAFTFDLQFRLPTDLRLTDSPLLFYFTARIQPGQFVAAKSSPVIPTWHENR